ncbi:MAG: helix-turn-helix transcriptional regulator [Pseudomonadales bacterium]|nr:helix-turn-helix transcriptional regulator [Pseudomonadales bacterium]
MHFDEFFRRSNAASSVDELLALYRHALVTLASDPPGRDSRLPDKTDRLTRQFQARYARLVIPHTENQPLSVKELDVLRWCAQGFTRQETADHMRLSAHTIDFHLRNAMRKLQARNCTAAVVRALELGVLQL